MFNFNGEYRRTREQNLAGASRLSGKNELIMRAQNERTRRQLEKKREFSAMTIQRVYRGYLSRLRLKRRWAMEFLDSIHKVRFRLAELRDIKFLVPRMHMVGRNYFSKSHLDTVMRAAIVQSKELLQLASHNKSWMWRIIVILGLTLKAIEECEVETSTLQLLLLACETLDKFTSIHDNLQTTSRIIIRLTERNYLIVMRDLAIKLNNYKLIYQATDIGTLELCNYALELIRRPFRYYNKIKDNIYKTSVILNFAEMIFIDSAMSNGLKDYILPALYEVDNFPVRETVDAFVRNEEKYNVPIALYFFLLFDNSQKAIPNELQSHYMKILSRLTQNFYRIAPIRTNTEEQKENIERNQIFCKEILIESVKLLNTAERSQIWCDIITEAIRTKDEKTIIAHCKCFMHLLILDSNNFHRFRVFNDVWTVNGWLRTLWITVESQARINYDLSLEDNLNLLGIAMMRGSSPTKEEAAIIVPLITVFTNFLFSYLSFTSDSDSVSAASVADILINGTYIKPFHAEELIYIINLIKDVSVGLLQMGFLEPNNISDADTYLRSPTNNELYNSVLWAEALMGCTKLVREFYQRNERCRFTSVSNWYCFLNAISETGIQNYVNLHNALKKYHPFSVPCLPRKAEESVGVWYDKAITQLNNLPFTLQFVKRHKILCNVIRTLMSVHQNSDVAIAQPPNLASIRRLYLYEDSYSRFNVHLEPEMKVSIRIRFINSLELDEIGVDGGGIMKEFLNELLKTAFDPNRGFFSVTRDNKFYPNPNVAAVYPEYEAHYFFIGRMLGKAIFENIIVDLPLADFFLSQIVYPDVLFPSLLQTLDSDVFRNLSYLLTYNDDYANLGLDFSLSTNCFGIQRIVELIPNGLDTPVTKNNVREYIYLVAKQKLINDIESQTRAFVRGLADVIPLHIIRMFTPNELQHIISGSDAPIDLKDMKKNVVYNGGFDETDPTIVMLWEVLESFTDQQKRQLLKFVTCCSRPPLLGFDHFFPSICIHKADGLDDRLPTSSTCMNMLKLPTFTNAAILKQKLLYAIQACSGFELT